MRPLYITRQRMRILTVLSQEERPMTSAEIADKARLGHGTVRVTLPRLVEHGWLTAAPAKGVKGDPNRYALVPHMRAHIRSLVMGKD